MRKKIVWVSLLFMDKSLYKTTQIEILTHLARRGHEAILIALYSEEKYKSESSDLHVITVPLRNIPIITNVIFNLILLFFLPFYVLYLKPDFIIVEPQDATAFSMISLLLFPKSKRPKIILDARTSHFQEKLRTSSVRAYINDLTFFGSFHLAKKFFDGITTITPMMKEDFCAKLKIIPKSVGVWTSGVNTKLFNPQKLAKKGKKLRIGLDLADKFIVFYHGDFGSDNSPSRGIIETIKSIEILKDKINNLVLFLLGRSQLTPMIKKMIKKSGMQNKVIIHDPVDYENVPQYIAMCDVGIIPLPDLPEWRYQCPLKLLEYLAMGKVVIATDIPMNRYVIGKCKCGIYISRVNPEEIAKAITYAHNHIRKLRQWGSYGRAIVSKSYTWEKVAKDLEDYLLQR